MSALPENWEFDYDGSRWFYRYKPTGLVQYNFPKPGDEFPEFIDAFAPPLDLAPEEKLESQQQLKRQSTTTGPQGSRSRANKQKQNGLTFATFADSNEGDGLWFQPENYTFLGPGAYTDVSPFDEEDENAAGKGSKKEGGSAVAPPSLNNKNVSPLTSAGTTPQTSQSNPATSTPVMGEVVVGGRHRSIDAASVVDAGFVVSPEVPMLDGRQIAPNPLGVVAELTSEMTAQCREESHPPPVELPVHDYFPPVETTEPTSYIDAFDMAPVELPAPHSPVEKTKQGALENQKVLRSPDEVHHNVQRQRADTDRISQPPKNPYQNTDHPTIQQSQPPPQPKRSQTADSEIKLVAGQYQPYNPAAGRILEEEDSKRSSVLISGQFTVVEHQERELGVGSKRHSIAGAIPAKIDLSDVPAALQPPRVPQKAPLEDRPGGNTIGVSHVPSVLKPAGGRQTTVPAAPRANAAMPAAPIQPWRPSQTSYAAYTPSQLRQSSSGPDDDQTFQAVDGQQPQAAQDPKAQAHQTVAPAPVQPGLTRTSTLPVDMPSLPFMGTRPPIPAHSQSTPAVQQSHQIQGLQSSFGKPVQPSLPNTIIESADLAPKPLAIRPRPDRPKIESSAMPVALQKPETSHTVEDLPQMTANFASATPLVNRPGPSKPDHVDPPKRSSEEFPKYVVDDTIPEPQTHTLSEAQEPAAVSQVSPPTHSVSVSSFSIASETMSVISFEPPPSRIETRPQSSGKPEKLPGLGVFEDSPAPMQETSEVAETSKPMRMESSSSRPLSQEAWQRVDGKESYHQQPHGADTPLQQATQAFGPPPLAANSSLMHGLSSQGVSSIAGLHSHSTPPPTQSPAAHPLNGANESPSSSITSVQIPPTLAQSAGVRPHKTSTPPPSSQNPSARPQSIHHQSPHGSVAGSPSFHRPSLSSATADYKTQSQPTPPPGQSFVSPPHQSQQSGTISQSPVIGRPPSSLGQPGKIPEQPSQAAATIPGPFAGPQPTMSLTDVLPVSLDVHRPPHAAPVNFWPQAQAAGAAGPGKLSSGFQHEFNKPSSEVPPSSLPVQGGPGHTLQAVGQGVSTHGPGSVSSSPQGLLGQRPPAQPALAPAPMTSQAQASQWAPTAGAQTFQPSSPMQTHQALGQQTSGYGSVPSPPSQIPGYQPGQAPSVQLPQNAQSPPAPPQGWSQHVSPQGQMPPRPGLYNPQLVYQGQTQPQPGRPPVQQSTPGAPQNQSFLGHPAPQFHHSQQASAQTHLHKPTLQAQQGRPPAPQFHTSGQPQGFSPQGLGLQQPAQSAAQQQQIQGQGTSMPVQQSSWPQMPAQFQQPGQYFVPPQQHQQQQQQQQQQKPPQDEPMPIQPQGQMGGHIYANSLGTEPPKINTSNAQLQQQPIVPSSIHNTPAGNPAVQHSQGNPGSVSVHQQASSMQLNIQVQPGVGQQQQSQHLPQQQHPPSIFQQPGITQQPGMNYYTPAAQQPGMMSYAPLPSQPSGGQPGIAYSPQQQQPGLQQQPQSQIAIQTSGLQQGNGLPTPQSATPGKEKKDWFHKMIKSDVFQKTSFAVGGAILAETMGSSAAAGAKIGSAIFDTTKKNKIHLPPPVQISGQPQHPQLGVQTAPPTMQGLPLPNGQHVGSNVGHGTPQTPMGFAPHVQPGHPIYMMTNPGHPQGSMGPLPPRPPMATMNSAPASGQGPPQPTATETIVDALIQSATQSISSAGQQQGQPSQQPSGVQHQYSHCQDDQQQPLEQNTTIVYNTQVTEVNVTEDYNVDVTDTVSIDNSVAEEYDFTAVYDTDVVSVSDAGGWGAGTGYDGSGWGDEDDG